MSQPEDVVLVTQILKSFGMRSQDEYKDDVPVTIQHDSFQLPRENEW